MPKKRFTNEQVVFALRQTENVTLVGEICRKMEVAEATFYRWKKVYAGMGESEVRRLKQLEEKNAKLKRLVADRSLDKTILQDAPQKGGEARPTPRGGPALLGGVRRVGALGLLGQRLRTGLPPLQVAPRPGSDVAHAVEGLGREPSPLWVQASAAAGPHISRYAITGGDLALTIGVGSAVGRVHDHPVDRRIVGATPDNLAIVAPGGQVQPLFEEPQERLTGTAQFGNLVEVNRTGFPGG